MLWGHSVPTLSLQGPTCCSQLCTGVSWTVLGITGLQWG